MDGGKQLLALVPENASQIGPFTVPERAATPIPGPAAQPAESAWASMLRSGTGQGTGQDATQAPPAAGPGWAALLKAHVKQAGGLRAAAKLRDAAGGSLAAPDAAQGPEALPVKAFAEALALLRDQLLRERERADAAETEGRSRIAAAEARVLAAEQALQTIRSQLAERDAELAALQLKVAETGRRADKAEREMQLAHQAARQLRGRGLLARILNRD